MGTMKIKKLSIILYCCLLFWTTTTLNLQETIPIHIVVYNEYPLFKKVFSEPFETLLLIFRDGTMITMTAQLENAIPISAWTIGEIIGKHDKKIKDIALAIHNHLIPVKESFGNKYVYRRLKKRGFKGVFCIYYPFSGEVRALK